MKLRWLVVCSVAQKFPQQALWWVVVQPQWVLAQGLKLLLAHPRWRLLRDVKLWTSQLDDRHGGCHQDARQASHHVVTAHPERLVGRFVSHPNILPDILHSQGWEGSLCAAISDVPGSAAIWRSRRTQDRRNGRAHPAPPPNGVVLLFT